MKLLLASLVFVACQSSIKTIESETESQPDEPTIPKFTVKVNGTDSLDTIPITLSYRLPIDANYITDTIRLNENGEGSFENVMGTWAMEYTLNIGDIFSGTAFLEKGLHLEIDLNVVELPEEEINFDIPNGISFSGKDAEKTNVLNAYSAFEHPIKDSLSSLFMHI
ncbi:MAG: hypothetical protein KDC92_01795 [Bacteroidetes bacterium]|nr:hypothetical protein [Bacteroidota bacterium]